MRVSINVVKIINQSAQVRKKQAISRNLIVEDNWIKFESYSKKLSKRRKNTWKCRTIKYNEQILWKLNRKTASG